ncbi:MAG: divergent polysaccharide deacetylase family protein [Rhodobacteraceae bacterium]|nr:divergent polysaccharide deacetylase family protein [Paracoccaceae bacterium]
MPGAPEPATPPAAGEAVAAAEVADVPALQLHAQPFEDATGRPRLAILLSDAGGAEASALAGLDMPLAVVVDPLRPGAAADARAHRAAGREVVALATGIPPGATAADVAVTFESHAAVLPEAVAVLDPDSGGFRADAALARAVVPILADAGLGMILPDLPGLESASRIAAGAGVPAVRVTLAVTAAEDAAGLRRALDRAVFRANQTGAAILYAPLTPAVAEAVAAWAAGSPRAGQVALAPVSAVLTGR